MRPYAPVSLLLSCLLCLVAGCGSSSIVSSKIAPPVRTLTPGVVAGTANPLVASYTISPPSPASVSIQFGPDATYGFTTSSQEVSTSNTPVSIQVAGMKASSTYHMRAHITYDDGTTQDDADQTFTTGAIPAGIVPSFTVSTTTGLTPQPGVELVDVLPGATNGEPLVTDLAGNVIWYYAFPDYQQSDLLYPIKLLPNGHMMFLIALPSQLPITTPTAPGALNAIREIDLAGNTIRQLNMSDLNASMAAAGFNITLQLFTHDFAALPNGHILVLANTLKTFNDLPGYPGATNVLGDVVVDLDPNFKPVWVWNEFDHFDVNRHPMNFPDWTHSNAVVYSPDDGSFLVSMRHQNWVVKVDYRNGAGSGAVLWKLGQGGDFKLQGGVDPTDWFYAQHDPTFVSKNTTGSFTLALMDNGDDRMFPPSVTCNGSGVPPCQYTTIPVMQIDENAKTASLVFHDSVDFYSSFAGSTRVLPNTNVEYNLAGVGDDAYTDEVTPTSNPQTVWEMHISGSNTYRSFRMPSLYPGVQW